MRTMAICGYKTPPASAIRYHLLHSTTGSVFQLSRPAG
jgi:hypothetical protein